jgi:hypothetical protein
MSVFPRQAYDVCNGEEKNKNPNKSIKTERLNFTYLLFIRRSTFTMRAH